MDNVLALCVSLLSTYFYHPTQLTTEVYRGYLDKGFDIRPTIAVTKAHIDLPETVSSCHH